MGNYSARFWGGHLEKGSNAPRQVSTLQHLAYWLPCWYLSRSSGIRLRGRCIHMMQPWRPGCESMLDV
jgi:hypothetical protein